MAKYSRVKQSSDVTNFTSTAELPLSGLRRGETAFANNSLYISNGSGWYRITLVNESPSITLDSEAVSLGSSGNTVTVGYTVVEPEGTPVNVTATSTANSSQANFTINSSNNSLTIENLSAEGFSANVTLTATDGVNIGTDSLVLNVIYLSELWDETVLSIGTSSTNSLDNSTFIDRSTNAHTVTPTGSPVQTAFHPYLDNWSVEFDGSNYFTAPSHTSFDIGTGDFTFECWVYKETNNRIMLQAITGAGLSISINTSGNIEVNRTLTAIDFTFTSGIVSNTWTHIAVTRSGTDLRAFKDGVLLGTQTSTTDYGQGVCYVGVDGNGTSSRYIGFISDFRLVKGTAVYTSAFTPPTGKLTAVSGTSLLTCQSNRFIDNSSNAHSITVAGNPVVSSFNPFGQESEYAAGENKGSTLLNGTNNYLSLPSSSLYNFTGDFTIEAWVYINGNSPLDNGSTRTAIIVNTQQNSNGIAFQIGGNSSTTGINLNVEIRSGTNIGYAATATIPQQSWNHCVVVRSSGTLTFYLNGVNIGTSAVSTNIPAGALTVGYMGNTGYPRYLNGLISDIRIVNGTAVYTSNFTPPTAPIGNTNASLYLPMDNAGIFDKTGINSIEYQVNVAKSTSQTKYSSTSILHDNDVTLITLPTGLSSDFTIEGWFYVNDTTAVSGFFQFRDDTGQSNSNEGLSFGKGSNFDYRYANGTAVNTGTISTIQGQWFHFAYARTSNTLKAFINGTQDLSVSDSTDYSAFKYLHLGMFFSSGYTGDFYVENFQVLNGVAKYTSNFTPPIQTQGRIYQAES